MMERPQAKDTLKPTLGELMQAFEYGQWCVKNGIEFRDENLPYKAMSIRYGMFSAWTDGAVYQSKLNHQLQEPGHQ